MNAVLLLCTLMLGCSEPEAPADARLGVVLTVLGAGRSLLPDPEGPNGYLVRYVDEEAERIADELGIDELARLEQAGADLDRDGMIDLLTD